MTGNTYSIIQPYLRFYRKTVIKAKLIPGVQWYLNIIH